MIKSLGPLNQSHNCVIRRKKVNYSLRSATEEGERCDEKREGSSAMLTAEDSSGGSSGSDDIGSNGVDQGPVSNQINSGSIHGFVISVTSLHEILSLHFE